MMKRFIYILSLISILVVSCTQENLPGYGERENCITLRISNSSLDTKVDRAGNDIENTINSLDFYFFPEGATESNSTLYKRVTFDTGVLKTTDVHLYITDDEFGKIFPNNNQNNCVVFVIANLPEANLPAEGDHTTLQALKQIHIEENFIDEDAKPVTPSSFVMHGEQVLTRSSNTSNSVTGEVNLLRIAAKITLRIKLPDHIIVQATSEEGDGGTTINQIWSPEFSDLGPSGPLEHTFVGLRNGVSADKIAVEYTPDADEYFNTDIYCGTFTHESSAASYDDGATSGAQIHTYRCDLTFYSYSSKWNSGDMHAPCFILQIPWKNTNSSTYVTHYYQVQINSYGKELASNHWYDLTLNVGVLGSTVAALPKEINSCSYQVLDWSHITTVFDREEEEVDIEEWQYLIINESQVVMNNTRTGTFYFDSSHSIAWNLEWPKQSEMTAEKYNFIVNDFDEIERQYNAQNKYASYYLDCTTKSPYAVCLDQGNLNFIKNSCFSVSGRQFTFTLPEQITDQATHKIYTPVYVHVKVWLDMDSDDVLDAEEMDHVYHLTFVYHPPMYILPDTSTQYSIFVNGRHRYTTTQNGNIQGIDIKHGSHNLGEARGDSDQGDDLCMYVISVSSFTKDDTFRWRAKQSDSYVQKSYIIGDPRSRSPMNFANYGMTNNWVRDQIPYNNNWTTYNQNVGNGQGRRLEYYYPTSTEAEAYRIVAPKFRMSSFYGGYSNDCTPEGAVLRCASYQEDGYPAGRWRVPTTAEVQYVIMLQQIGAILPIFYKENWYYSASQQVQSLGEVRATSDDNDKASSVRCVYDEWYWGSERDAVPHSGYAGRYEFTWGDKLIY